MDSFGGGDKVYMYRIVLERLWCRRATICEDRFIRLSALIVWFIVRLDDALTESMFMLRLST